MVLGKLSFACSVLCRLVEPVTQNLGTLQASRRGERTVYICTEGAFPQARKNHILMVMAIWTTLSNGHQVEERENE